MLAAKLIERLAASSIRLPPSTIPDTLTTYATQIDCELRQQEQISHAELSCERVAYTVQPLWRAALSRCQGLLAFVPRQRC